MDGYAAGVAWRVADVSQRCLEYWHLRGIVVPSIERGGRGPGHRRLYSFQDLVRLSVVRRLREAGLSLNRIRQGVEALRAQGSKDPLLCEVLLSSGKAMFRRVDENTLEDVLAKGQMVFSVIAIAQVEADTRKRVAALMTEDTPARKAARSR